MKKTVEQITREIEQIKKLDLLKSKNNITKLKEKIGMIIAGQYLFCTIGVQFPNVFRVRPNDGKELYRNTEKLKHPPKDKVKQFGRFNNKGESIFYCSATWNPCAFECSPEPEIGDWITLTEYEAIDINKKIAVTHVFANSLKNLEGIEISKSYINLIKNHRNIIIDHDIEKQHDIIQSFFELIALREVGHNSQYKLSIAIKDLIFLESAVNGILYPSVATENQNINLALKPEVADASYNVKKVRVFKVVEKKEKEYLLCLVNQSTNINENTGDIQYEQ